MKRTGLLVGLAGAMLGLILTGCVTRPEITALPPNPMLPGWGTITPESETPVLPSPTPTETATATPEAVEPEGSNCVECHTDQDALTLLAAEPEEAAPLPEGEGWAGSMPPLEAWEAVLVSSEDFLGSIHASLGCIACHGGVDGATEIEAAHEGVVSDPDPVESCASCHDEIVQVHTESLHWTLAGLGDALAARSDEEHWPQLTAAYDDQCVECHASCGQCHVSRPAGAGGGLLDGHLFKATPPTDLTCSGCHGSRVDDEYEGRNETVEGDPYPADVHFDPGGMSCVECHSGDELHGADGVTSQRYDGPPSPSCTAEGCHEAVQPGDGIQQHAAFHMDRLACQVCHTVEYENCTNCHVQLAEEGSPSFSADPPQMLFRIGRNPIQSEDRPWEYVVVRHVPIARDSFAAYGDDLLPNFVGRPTWVYATPHNIQRVTPQNSSCIACHGNPAIFLTADDVDADELEANRGVIVEEVPPAP